MKIETYTRIRLDVTRQGTAGADASLSAALMLAKRIVETAYAEADTMIDAKLARKAMENYGTLISIARGDSFDKTIVDEMCRTLTSAANFLRREYDSQDSIQVLCAGVRRAQADFLLRVSALLFTEFSKATESAA